MNRQRFKVTLFFINNLPWVLVFFFYVVFSIINPSAMLSLDMLVFMLHSIIPLGFLVLAQGLCLISGKMDLSVAAMTGFIGTSAGLFLRTYSTIIPEPLSFFVPLIFGVACGTINAYFIGVMGFNHFIVTLGTLMLFQGARFLLYKGDIMGRELPAFYLQPGGNPLLSIASFSIILLIFWFILNYTRTGVYLYAVGTNPDASARMGISLKRQYVILYLTCGLLSGFSALYYTGYNNSVPITMATQSLFPSFAGAVIGGISLAGGQGSMLHAFAGTILLGVIEGGLTLLRISPEERTTVYGLLVITAIIINKYRDSMRDKIMKQIIISSTEKEREEDVV